MTLLYLCWEYPPNGSGIGRYVAEMSSALDRAGHHVVVLTSRADGCPEREQSGNHQVLRLFDRAEMRTERVARLAVNIARNHHADWIETADHWGEGCALLRQRNRPPVAVKMHYNDVLKTPRYAQAWYPWQRLMIDLACLRQWRTMRAERYGLEHADVLLAPCGRILDEARCQGLSLPARCAVIPNPICVDREQAGREAEAPTLLLVGRLDMGKGLPYLRNLLESLLPRFPGLRLEIAGGDSYARGIGSLRAWLEKSLGPLGRSVVLHGPLDHHALDEAYSRAWVVIVPSRWDTFPQVVLEAMVRGKAIVASPHGGMPEMLQGTLCAVAEPASQSFAAAVAGFLQDRETRRRAGGSARARVAEVYCPSRIAAAYVQVVGDFLHAKPHERMSAGQRPVRSAPH